MKVAHIFKGSKVQGTESEPPLTKRQQRRLDKKVARYLAFVSYANTPLYIRPGFVKELIKGLILDREKNPLYLLHHKINFGGIVKITIGLRAYNKELEEGL